jgi:hypothetical protein
MFGPVTMCSREVEVNSIEFGVNTRLALNNPSSTVGWRPFITLNEVLRSVVRSVVPKTGHVTHSVFMTGRTKFISVARLAKAKVTSSSSIIPAFRRKGPERPLTCEGDKHGTNDAAEDLPHSAEAQMLLSPLLLGPQRYLKFHSLVWTMAVV